MAIYENITEEMAEQLLDQAFIENLQQREQLLPQLMQLKGPIPDGFVSQYLVTYQDRVTRARNRFNERIKEIDGDIAEIRAYYTEEKGEEYTPEQEKEDRELLLKDASDFLNRDLLVADSYKNDLKNYAVALLNEWKKSGKEGSLLDGSMATCAKSIPYAMYHQMVEKEYEFEPTEPIFPLLAYGVGLGLFGGVSAVLWRRRAREIARLERIEQQQLAKREFDNAMHTLDDVIRMRELRVLELEAKLELEQMEAKEQMPSRKERLNLYREMIRDRKANIAKLKAQKAAIDETLRNQRRVHRLRRRMRSH